MRKLQFNVPATVTPSSSGQSRAVTVPILATDRAEATKLARAWLLDHGWSAREFKLWGCEAHGPDVTCEHCS